MLWCLAGDAHACFHIEVAWGIERICRMSIHLVRTSHQRLNRAPHGLGERNRSVALLEANEANCQDTVTEVNDANLRTTAGQLDRIVRPIRAHAHRQ